jgi:hypothetical protein
MEAFKNIRTVRQLTKENYFITCYETLLLKPHRFVIFHFNTLYKNVVLYFPRSNCKRAHITGFLFSFSNAVVFFAQAALTAFAVFLVQKNRITFEDALM